MAHKHWTKAQVALLSEMYPNTRTRDLAEIFGRSVTSVYAKAQLLGLTKSQAFLDSHLSGRLVPGDDRGASGRFTPGMTPWNKGASYEAGGRSAETRFQPGERRGRANHLYQPIGTERVSKDGYLQRKVNDDMPLQRRWKMVHHIVWEQHHGPVPRGHAIAFRNGDKTDVQIDNLELISRRELMSRNTVQNLPKELAEVCQLKGALTRQINKRMKA